jgi:hypothetical protein
MYALNVFFSGRVCYQQNASYRKIKIKKIKVEETLQICKLCSFLAQNSPKEATDFAKKKRFQGFHEVQS